MIADLPTGYLGGLPKVQRDALSTVNQAGLRDLCDYLASSDAVAFAGAGVSRPLYPLWQGLISDLVDAAADRLNEDEASTCRVLAAQGQEEVVEIVRRRLGISEYRHVLREVLRVRTDPGTGRSWTPVQELLCRCAFKGVVTTNYDPGIVDARMRVRATAVGTGFTSWRDEIGMDRWRTGDAFGDVELPVLFAHGLHSQPDSVVLAASEYRQAYGGKLSGVLGALADAGHLVWLGFSFADQRISTILREIRQRSGTRAEPGSAPRHVAVMPWDPAAEGNDPGILAQRAEISYGAKVVLYPAPSGDHDALAALLSELVDPRFPPAAELPARTGVTATAIGTGTASARPPVPALWVHGAETTEHFTGRVEELTRLDRWAADKKVALVGVTAWGGAGKTALVTRWVQQGGWSKRAGVRGVFAWSFYADPSAERWADALMEWADQEFGFDVKSARPADLVLSLLRTEPLLLVLDGLEVMQEVPVGDGFGRLLDGMLREVLTGICRLRLRGLVLLTSRFPFADLENFDGDTARMLDVPAFSPAQGAALLAAAGGDWLDESHRRELVEAVDGHALAVGVLARVLASRPPAADLKALAAELTAAARTDARVLRVLRFYAERLPEPDRYLIAAVSLFSRPVAVETVLALAEHEAFCGQLTGWTQARVIETVQDRLGGLVSLHPDGTLSAHPLVHDTFRPLVVAAASAAADTVLTGLPGGQANNRASAQQLVEVIELLLDAGQWEAADHLYRSRTSAGATWKWLPAARLGQRATSAFVGTPARSAACAATLSGRRQSYYLGVAGLLAMYAGDLVAALEYLRASVLHDRRFSDIGNLSVSLVNLAECLAHLGETGPARQAAAEARLSADTDGRWRARRTSRVLVAWVAASCGDVSRAEEHFISADQFEIAQSPRHHHLHSSRGVWWADWLACTGRTGPALRLTERNRKICKNNHWNEDVARCDRVLGRLELTAGHLTVAGEQLDAAAGCFRDGDYLVDLADTLPDLAEHARLTGDLDAADRHVDEAISITAPRGLVPAQSSALTARARISADRATTSGDPDLLARGRDAADAALRLGRRHHLAWCELDAVRAHAALDQAEGIDNHWAIQAGSLYARLVPPDLNPDPLAANERLVPRMPSR